MAQNENMSARQDSADVSYEERDHVTRRILLTLDLKEIPKTAGSASFVCDLATVSKYRGNWW